MAWSNESWILDGADVRVSLIGFDDGSQQQKQLNGVAVEHINADLTAITDVTNAKGLKENAALSFVGIQKGGPFDIPGDTARAWLPMANPNGRTNEDVIHRFVGGMDITRRFTDTWLIDFNQMGEGEAGEYIVPFAYVAEHVKPVRVGLRRANHAKYWWIHHEPRPGMRKALSSLKRYLGTSMVSKHRFFVWLDSEVVPSNKVVVIARDDDFTFGVLNSYAHALWSSVKGGKHGVGNDLVYQNGTCFETFPFPRSTDAQHADIEKWAKYLDTVRAQLLAADEKRTMTKLYNDLTVLRETRDSSSPVYALLIAHDKLDAAVAAAYGWEWPLSDEAILERLLALNLERAAQQEAAPTVTSEVTVSAAK